MKAGAGPYIMATHAAPPQSSILPHVHVPPPAHTAYNIHVPIEIVCSSRSIMKMVINIYICVYLCLHVCVCVCPCSCCRLCCFCPYGVGEGGLDCFQFDIKVQDIAKCRSGLSEHFSKVRKFFPSLSLLLFFFFSLPAHTMSPQAQLSVRLCVCVCVSDLFMFIFEA